MKNIFQAKRRCKGQSAIEYSLLAAFILGALLMMQRPFAQAMYGRWKTVGESMGFGRQYDPNKMTSECALDTKYHAPEENFWYDVKLFEDNCQDKCWGPTATYDACKGCFPACPAPPATGGIPPTTPAP